MISKEKESLVKPIKLPFFQTVLGCYDIFFSKFWSFACLGGLFALILTFMFFASGQETLCYNSEYNSNHFCTKNSWNYGIIHLLAFILCFIFMQKWYQFLKNDKSFAWKKVLLPDLGTLKMIVFFILYVFTMIISSFSFYLLYIRVPNPNWRIEIIYFTLVSVGFIFPILGLRFFSYFAYAAENERLPSIKTIWIKTSGNMLVIIGGCSFLLMLAMFLTQTIIQQTNVAKPIMAHALFIEYLSQLFILTTLSCFINYCYIQKNCIEKDDKNEKNC